MRRIAAVLCALLIVPGSLSAQTPPGGHAFRSTFTMSPLVDLQPGADGQLLPQSRMPSGRLLLAYQITPVLGLQIGGLRLAPADRAVWAGTAGFRLNLGTGRFRLAPFAEALAGRVSARVTMDTISYYDASSQSLQPWVQQDVRTRPTYGAGGGVTADVILGSGFTLSLTGGYWYSATQDARVGASRGAYAGVGLGFALPDRGWYRRQFGHAPEQPMVPMAPSGPEIRIEKPAAWTRMDRGLGIHAKTSIDIEGVARDLSGIESVTINGRRAALELVNPDGSAVRFRGYAPVEAGTRQVVVSARARNAATTTREYPVQPLPAETGPMDVAAGVGQRYAVVIGVSTYADSAIRDLKFADDDALAFRDFLLSDRAGLGGIPPQNVRVLVNEQATYRAMRTALFSFLERADENDIVYVFIAGHGAPNSVRPEDLYLLPYDAELDNMAGTALPMSDVHAAIRKLRARHVVLLVDACHSAGVAMEDAATRGGDADMNAINERFLEGLQSSQSGLAVFTASEARQLSMEGKQWGGGHGVFTYYLLQGLDGAADRDGDSIVFLGELIEYVRDTVRDATGMRQVPAIATNAYDRFLPMALVPQAPEP